MNFVLRASLVIAVAVSPLVACSSSSSDNPGGGGGGGGDGGGGGGSSCAGTDACFAVAVAIGTDGLSCAAMKDGSGRCWGPAEHGGRGRGNDTTNIGPEPQPIVQLAQASGLFLNSDASCALLKDGSVSCWGNAGTVGNGTGQTASSEVPKGIGVTGATQIAGGVATTCALLQDGSAKCWQDVSHITAGGSSAALSPANVPEVQGAKELAVGAEHLCALYGDATVKCIGSNTYGQIGDGTDADANEMRPVTGLTSVAHISAGQFFTCAVLTDGTAKCWGQNDSGQLGDGSTTKHNAPVAVTDLANADRIAAAGEAAHACARLKDGAVKCWGANQVGQLGDGTTTDQNKAVAVTGLTGATAIAVGREASCAIRGDGRVVCWGANSKAEFGARSQEKQTTPFVVPW